MIRAVNIWWGIKKIKPQISLISMNIKIIERG